MKTNKIIWVCDKCGELWSYDKGHKCNSQNIEKNKENADFLKKYYDEKYKNLGGK